MAQPYLKWFGIDWRSDACLRQCKEASRGVWADMLTFMMEAEPYGHFLVSRELFCSMTVTRPRVFDAAIADLEKNGVFSRNAEGVIFSRRMLRDAAKSEEAKAKGKLGGNPALVKPGQLKPNGFNSADNPHGYGYGKEGSSGCSKDSDGEDFE